LFSSKSPIHHIMESRPLISDDRPILNKWQTIILAGSTAAFLDACAAIFILGARPDSLFKFIASALLGTDAFKGGVLTILLGIILHFVIAHAWAILFFHSWPRLKRLVSNLYLIAIAYGVVIWLVMNLILLPLTKIPTATLTLNNSWKGIAIIIVAVAYPIVVFTRRYYLIEEELKAKV
jgi:hypothetical protein